MGQQLGQGKGGTAPMEKTDVDFKVERQKVHTGKGAIIGQFQVDGEQVKGDTSKEAAEVVSAAEREASDLVHRDRIPKQYHAAIKAYFSNLHRATGDAKTGDAGGKAPEAASNNSRPGGAEPDRPQGGPGEGRDRE